MADIATVFSWSLESLERMSFAELIAWHRRAIARAGAGA